MTKDTSIELNGSTSAEENTKLSDESRKRKALEQTLEELQNERERLRDKNRTNSQRFRDRKKDYVDSLFEEKYRLGKDNEELKSENERLRKLLEEALAENELHRLRRRNALYSPCASIAPPSLLHNPSLLYGDHLLRQTSRDGIGSALGYSSSGLGDLVVPTITNTGIMPIDSSSFPVLGGSFGFGFGLGRPMELPSQTVELEDKGRSHALGLGVPENIPSS